MRALMQKSTMMIAAVGAALLIALTGCSAPAEPEVDPGTITEMEAPKCSGLTGIEALEKWSGEVQPSREWDMAGEYSDVSGYDECAELSYIVLRPAECCTVFEITPIMFFNRGEFIPAATLTDRAQARGPESVTERIDDSTLALTFALPGGAGLPPVLTTTTFAWDEATGTVNEEGSEASATEAQGPAVNGRWCPTPESQDRYGCVTIAYPTATYDSGDTRELTDRGDLYGDGGTSYIAPGAPFGTFYPAGAPIALPDYYSGTDLPDQDRIWNGQTGTMLVRQ